jgi:hypothetical protein
LNIQSGVAFTGIKFTDMNVSDEISFRPTFTGRVGFEKFLKNNLSIVTELAYTQRGFKTEYSAFDFSTRRIFAIDYLELPILLKYHFFQTNKFSFKIGVGPTLGRGMGGRVLIQSNLAGIPSTDYKIIKFGKLGPHTHDPNEPDHEHLDHRYDIGVQALLGVAYKTNAGKIFLEGRAYWAMSNVYGKNQDAEVDNFSRYRVWSIQVGYAIPLSKN